MLDFESFVTSFVNVYTNMVEGRPLTCSKTSTEFAPLSPPDAAVLDVRFSSYFSQS